MFGLEWDDVPVEMLRFVFSKTMNFILSLNLVNGSEQCSVRFESVNFETLKVERYRFDELSLMNK